MEGEVKHPTGSANPRDPCTLPGAEGGGVGIELTAVSIETLLAEGVEAGAIDIVLVIEDVGLKYTLTAVQPAGRYPS
jgi:hypothetical protein